MLPKIFYIYIYILACCLNKISVLQQRIFRHLCQAIVFRGVVLFIDHPTFYNGCNYLSMLRLKLNHVSKRDSHFLNVRWCIIFHFFILRMMNFPKYELHRFWCRHIFSPRPRPEKVFTHFLCAVSKCFIRVTEIDSNYKKLCPCISEPDDKNRRSKHEPEFRENLVCLCRYNNFLVPIPTSEWS